MAPSISVIIVNYNTCSALKRCLQSLPDNIEVVCIDNASSDNSAEMVRAEFPTVRLIQNKHNRGFGVANNQGMDAASGSLMLLLNSDAWCSEDLSIEKLGAAFDDPEVLAAGGKLLNPDGTFQNSCARELTLWSVLFEQFFLERVIPIYWLGELRQATFVEQVMGACLMLRPGHRFDERFFLYCEDTELCKRLRVTGKIVYEPSAVFFHELGASSSSSRWQSVARYNRGKELYFATHHGHISAFLCLVLNRLGALVRLVAWSVLCAVKPKTATQKALLFARVLTCPIGGPKRSP